MLGALAPRGRLILVGLTAGRRAEIDLSVVLRHRLRLVGSVLRPRPRPEKAARVAAFAAVALPRLAAGAQRAVVDRVYPIERAVEAYAALEEGGVNGKIVLSFERVA
jgi:NADPH2:quinone reductase